MLPATFLTLSTVSLSPFDLIHRTGTNLAMNRIFINNGFSLPNALYLFCSQIDSPTPIKTNVSEPKSLPANILSARTLWCPAKPAGEVVDLTHGELPEHG